MSFQKVLQKYRDISFFQRDKGDRFERLMQAYLQTDPRYAHQFKEVWMWNDFPGRVDFGGTDTGIDLVAQTTEGEFWGRFCNFNCETSSVKK
jgi:predicted helicase